MFKFEEILSVEMCENNPSFLFVFGDNLLKKGKKGQAIIRDCKNAFGVPTKRLPSMDVGSFFSDKQDEYDVVKNKLIYLYNEHLKGKTIILPENQIGSGLANISKNSPLINKLISRFYEKAKEEINQQNKMGMSCLSQKPLIKRKNLTQ